MVAPCRIAIRRGYQDAITHARNPPSNNREKIEHFGPYYFISLRAPQQLRLAAGVRASSANVYATVFRESVISFIYDNS